MRKKPPWSGLVPGYHKSKSKRATDSYKFTLPAGCSSTGGITRSAYYKAAQRQKKNDSRDKIILEEVKRIRKNLPKLGTRKVYYRLKPFLKQNGIKMGRDKLFSLLKANGMLAERKKRMAFTTESRHYLFKYPNLVKELEPQRPHELWVSASVARR